MKAEANNDDSSSSGVHHPTVPITDPDLRQVPGGENAPSASAVDPAKVVGPPVKVLSMREAANPATTASYDPFSQGPQPPTLEPRLVEAAKIADPHLRQLVEANVRLGTQREIAAFTAQQRQVKAQAKNLIDQGGDLSSIPAKLMLQIDIPGREALRDYAMAQGNPTTEPATYYRLKNQALDDQAGFQAIDLGNHMAKLNAKDYGELQQLQSRLQNGQPPADLPLQRAYKANTDRMLEQLGLPIGISDDVQATHDAINLRRAVDQGLAAHEVVQGKKATLAEHQQILDQAVINHSRALRASLTLPGTLSDIPVTHLVPIIASFQAQGVNPSTSQILRAYQRLQEVR